jgi:hypothetical protein
VAVPPPMVMQPIMHPPVGTGAVFPPHEQFHHLAYCVHSNPSWGKETPTPSFLLFFIFPCVFLCWLVNGLDMMNIPFHP